MEEDEMGRMPDEDPPPPDFEDTDISEDAGIAEDTRITEDVKVKVIKPFKPGVRISRMVRQGKCFYHPTKPASYICSSCSKSICGICGTNIGGAYFCPQCAPYRKTVYTPPPQPKETPTSDTSWYRALFSIGIVLIILGALLALAYWPLTSMSASDFDDMEYEYYDQGGHNFKDFRPGDTIVIRDTIIRIEADYDLTYGVITIIWFESTGEGDTDFSIEFDADLEQDYHIGDTVSITLHVEEDSRTHNEIIQEFYNNHPDISNIDHTFSIDIVFYSMIVLGAFFVFIYMLFSKKVKQREAEGTAEGEIGEASESKGL